MGDIGREIGLSGKDIFNLFNHMVEGDDKLFQLNGHARGLQARVKILRGDIFNGGTDVTQGQMPLAYRNANDKNNQQAHRCGNGKQILFQRIEVMQMKINGEPDQHHVALRFTLQRHRSRRGDNPVRFHLHAGPGMHGISRVFDRPEKHVLRATVCVEIRRIHRGA